ncbi:hypothetical protein ACQ3I4_05810 [Zafaria sp. Z1313]|uniref:hypothetical protein n=1 Tax=Zafaria sp. Z1313 TaxID=3423202 RepID=UPI003D3026AE
MAAAAAVFIPGIGWVIGGLVAAAGITSWILNYHQRTGWWPGQRGVMNRFAKITAVTASAYIWLAKAKKTTKPSGKETANNVPSWAVGKRRLPGETPSQAASRIVKQYGPKHATSAATKSYIQQIKKHLSRTGK